MKMQPKYWVLAKVDWVLAVMTVEESFEAGPSSQSTSTRKHHYREMQSHVMVN